MKKCLSILLALLLLFTTACSNEPTEEPAEPQTSVEEPVEEEPVEEEPVEEEPAEEEPVEEEPAEEEPAEEEPVEEEPVEEEPVEEEPVEEEPTEDTVVEGPVSLDIIAIYEAYSVQSSGGMLFLPQLSGNVYRCLCADGTYIYANISHEMYQEHFDPSYDPPVVASMYYEAPAPLKVSVTLDGTMMKSTDVFTDFDGDFAYILVVDTVTPTEISSEYAEEAAFSIELGDLRSVYADIVSIDSEKDYGFGTLFKVSDYLTCCQTADGQTIWLHISPVFHNLLESRLKNNDSVRVHGWIRYTREINSNYTKYCTDTLIVYVTSVA